jgi:uncharacterized membrane protein YcgQ (UPF0703/DUF1980 family)
VKVRGQFAPGPEPRLFSLARFRIQCCAADAVQYEVPVGCKEPITGIKRNDWIEVTGRIDFRLNPRNNSYYTIHLSPSRNGVAATNPDLNPYL